MLQEKNCKDLIELLQKASVPRNTVIDERPFEEADFATITQSAEECFAILESNISILQGFKNSDLDPHQLEYVYHTLLQCGEHSSNALWTNEECIRRSERVLKAVLALLNFEDLSSFLIACDSKKQLHGLNLFALLTPKLHNNEWKYYPAAVHSYCWLLRHIESLMGDFLKAVLPIPLNIVNDYQTENKVVALQCLYHILRHVSAAELNWHVQIEVLRKIVKPMFYYRETDLIVPLVECTLEIARKTESLFSDVENLQWCFMDDILTILLPMMEYEQNIARRCAYGECLPMILERSRISIAKWSPKILRIIDDYSKTPVTELAAMNALDQYTLNCWPFLQYHWRFINVIAGRIIFRSVDEKSIEVAEKVLRRLEQCLPPDTELKNVEYIRSRRKNIAK